MDGRFETEFDRDELIALVRELRREFRRELKTAHERIASLEKRVEELETISHHAARRVLFAEGG